MPKAQSVRTSVLALALSAAAFFGVTRYEGYTDKAVIPVPGDVPTIGFGTTTGVKLGDRITPQEAFRRSLQDLQAFETSLKSCVHVALYQHEYDAFVSLAYNIGSSAFCGSTLVRKLNAGDHAGACAEISRWNRQGGRVLPGLVKRRAAERAHCEGQTPFLSQEVQ
jgi:lysozyme